MEYQEVINFVRDNIKWYNPEAVKRKWIPKPGKNEKRPLGIPTIGDRVIQECVRMVIEPICEAQFYQHSYGFRPMRNTGQAIGRLSDVISKSGYHWVIEGDIKAFFDTVNHRIMLQKLYGIGIKDTKLLKIIQAMLEAGVMEEGKRAKVEIDPNEIGTPQGGLISPLLANVYLHSFDKWVAREWENKVFKKTFKGGKKKGQEIIYKNVDQKIDKSGYNAWRKRLHQSNLKPANLVRYADDWVLITNSKENAEKWKYKIERYLEKELKIELSKDKTLITNIRSKHITFLGIDTKFVPGRAEKGYVTHMEPNAKRLEMKIDEIRNSIKKIKRQKTRDEAIHQLNITNSKIRGLIEYYSICNKAINVLSNKAWQLNKVGYNTLKKVGGMEFVKAKYVDNLKSAHENREAKIPSLKHQNVLIGLTSLAFVNYDPNKHRLKNQKETPFSAEGREIYEKRTGSKTLMFRADEMLTIALSERMINNKKKNDKKKYKSEAKYNFEYYLNRPRAYNRDKGKCRICSKEVNTHNIAIHHESPLLPLNMVNKTQYLATVHDKCHSRIHDGLDYSSLPKKEWQKILIFREKLKRTAKDISVTVRNTKVRKIPDTKIERTV